MLAPRQKSAFVFPIAIALTVGLLGLSLPGQAAAESASRARKKEGAAGKESSAKPAPEKAAAPAPVAEATPAPPPANGSQPAALNEAEMSSAVTLDAMTIPTPGELFTALTKQCKPTWALQYRGPISTAFSSREQMALNLGGLIADGYVAVEAMDAQQVKNLGRDILSLAKNLGISKEILARGNSITQFAEDNDWSSLREELEATQNEVKQAMDALHDEELVTLLSLGGWIRGTQVVSSVVLKNFTPQTASILRQPGLVKFLHSKLDALSPETTKKPLIKQLDDGLGDIQTLVSFPLGGTATKEDVQKLNDEASNLVKAIATK